MQCFCVFNAVQSCEKKSLQSTMWFCEKPSTSIKAEVLAFCRSRAFRCVLTERQQRGFYNITVGEC